MRRIVLVEIGRVSADVLGFLELSLASLFEAHCRKLRTRMEIDEDAYSPQRCQYYSTQLLARLAELPVPRGAKVLGICELDLYVPVLTFVFGEAQLEGTAALLSTHRLREEFYGLPADQKIFLRRVEKEAAHELGHTFGLKHCRNRSCVMYFSNSVEQVDSKSHLFCHACRQATAGAVRPAT